MPAEYTRAFYTGRLAADDWPRLTAACDRLAKAPLFEQRSDDELLIYGVPVEWLADAKSATEDTLLALADHLPAEAAEALG